MRGRMQAILIAAVVVVLSLLFPPLSLLSAAAIALVTLRNGPREGLITIAGAGVAIGILGQILFNNAAFVITYALGFWIPVWIFSILLRESRHLNLTLEVALCLGFLVVFGIYLLNSDPASMWQERLHWALQPLIDNPPPGIEVEQFESIIKVMSHYMTGIFVTGSIISLIFGMLLGRWWQALLFNPGGFRKEFLGLKPHSPVAYISILVFIAAMLDKGELGEGMINAGILAFSFYLIIGTSVLHVLIATTSFSRYLLPLMYVLMLFVPHVLAPVALLGFTDTWANWRGRATAHG